jgi:hypothetical protein
MGYFLFFMRFAGVISRFVNGACCVNIKHIQRILMVTIMSIASFLAIAYSTKMAVYPSFFWIAIFASIFMGVAQSFGEAVIIGFCNYLPHKLMGSFSAGTGFAGPFSTVSLLGFKYF